MSAIVAAVEFVHARKWLVELLLATALIVGLWIAYAHKIDQATRAGIQKQIAADEKATDDLRKQVADLTAQNVALAAAAHAKYEDDHAKTTALASAPVGTSQLCNPTPYHRPAPVPATGTAHAGDAPGAAPAPVVQPVSAADSGLAYDRRGLLSALAALSDDGSAVIREYQERQRR